MTMTAQQYRQEVVDVAGRLMASTLDTASIAARSSSADELAALEREVMSNPAAARVIAEAARRTAASAKEIAEQAISLAELADSLSPVLDDNPPPQNGTGWPGAD